MKSIVLFILFPFLLLAESLEEKIGYLFMVPAHPDHLESLETLLDHYPIKSIISKATDSRSHLAMLEKLPDHLIVGVDAEWGLGMRMKDQRSYPKNRELNHLSYEEIYAIGHEIGTSCKYMLADINFAPVVDVNTNPLNPIIGPRSFGPDEKLVARLGEAMMKGMQEAGIIATAKHFPGHGDAMVDSHLTLPVVSKVSLYPFEQMCKKGVKAMMTAHLFVPHLDSVPVTFSRKIVRGILRQEYQFEGLIVTDALNMKAMTNDYDAGVIATKAFHAGHDLLLYGDHIGPNIEQILKVEVPKAFDALKKAFEIGELSMDELEASVERIKKARSNFY